MDWVTMENAHSLVAFCGFLILIVVVIFVSGFIEGFMEFRRSRKHQQSRTSQK